MITPPRIMVATTLLFVCSAVLFTLAGREPKAATVFGAALVSGAVTLAIFLSEQQRRRVTLAPEKRQQLETLLRQGRTLKAVRRLRESAPTDTRSAYRYIRHLSHKLERSSERHPSYTLRRAD